MARSHANLAIFVLSLAGCFISLFLTVLYVRSLDIPCTGGSADCNAVANDAAAWGLGIPALSAVPTPALGLAMYVGLAALAMFRVVTTSSVLSRKAAVLQWLIALIALVVSAYLTWREAAVIHHWCIWCMASAAIVLIIFIAATAEKVGGEPRTRAGVEVT